MDEKGEGGSAKENRDENRSPFLILSMVRCVETSSIRPNKISTDSQLRKLDNDVAVIIIHSISKTRKESTPGPEYNVMGWYDHDDDDDDVVVGRDGIKNDTREKERLKSFFRIPNHVSFDFLLAHYSALVLLSTFPPTSKVNFLALDNPLVRSDVRHWWAWLIGYLFWSEGSVQHEKPSTPKHWENRNSCT